MSRAWTIEELHGEAVRLGKLFGDKGRVELTVRPNSTLGKVSADIWPTSNSRDLKMVYGATFEAAIAAAEVHAGEWIMSNRVMLADDLGLDVAA